MDSPAVSSNDQRRNQSRGHDPTHNGAHDLVDQDRAHREAEQAAQQTAHQHLLVYPTSLVEAGVASRAKGIPCLVSALRNERLPKDFKGPRKVPN